MTDDQKAQNLLKDAITSGDPELQDQQDRLFQRILDLGPDRAWSTTMCCIGDMANTAVKYAGQAPGMSTTGRISVVQMIQEVFNERIAVELDTLQASS